MNNRKNQFSYHIMILPGMIFLLIFSIVPMFGLAIAFEKFNVAKGILHSQWVGLDNFIYLFQVPSSRQVFINTIIIAVLKMVAGLIVPLLYAVLLNEVRTVWFKRSIQTIIYLPHFLSWVILGNIVLSMLALDGTINSVIGMLGIKPIFFMVNPGWFRPVVIVTDTWKEAGFGTIIYLAAITAINPSLYEAAVIDGASRWGKIKNVTLPGITPTIILLATLSLGRVLDAGFDQVFNLYNPLLYPTADIIDTFVYRMGLVNAQYGLATSVGVIKSVISFALIIVSYRLASRYANYRIF